ncbi:hypothetical protein FACS1894127_6690 [Clostridia bacterium]|nr:hypothetical protein FACS1894127_6690 [Clostridia bacterium]
MITERVLIWGTVQGVGFRPFAAKTAKKLDMKGWVRNVGGLAELTITGSEEEINDFLTILKDELPPPGEVVNFSREILSEKIEFTDFTIIASEESSVEGSAIPADLAICEDCLKELRNPENPRYMHPFNSCMSCGPRFTIIERLPYDRENTSMVDFYLCDFCGREYEDSDERRYHAQTVSCHDCGPKLIWKDKEDEASSESADVIMVDGRGTTDVADTFLAGKPKDASWCHDVEGISKDMSRSQSTEVLSKAAEVILDGGVIALKGMGGYYFVCSPFNTAAVKRVREIKVREEKPFAVMFRDLSEIKKYCYVSPAAGQLLLSRARPIVLLERKSEDEDLSDVAEKLFLPRAGSMVLSERKSENETISEEVYKSSRYIGVFLPSMGAQYLLLDKTGPLVMTSANLSDRPIIKDDSEILELMAKQLLLDGVLYNERRILARTDDSVVGIVEEHPQMIRRSKGYVPSPIYISQGSGTTTPAKPYYASVGGEGSRKEDDIRVFDNVSANRARLCGESPSGQYGEIFAAGGQLKSAFTLTKGGLAYVSQFFGDLDSLETERVYMEGLLRMKRLFSIEPELIVCDLHPNYVTSRIAEEYSEKACIPILRVQHHHAHIASVMAEHDLKGPVIGVAFDGTGYGDDGRIWGGEFLLCEGGWHQRMVHLQYIPMIGGDSSMREGWKTALCYLHEFEKKTYSIDPNSGHPGKNQAEGLVYKRNKPNSGHPGKNFREQDAEQESREFPFEGDAESVSVDISEIIDYSNMKGHEYREEVDAAIRAGVNIVESSSVGRLFDGVASLLGIHHVNRYEGECAIMLENAAIRGQRSPGVNRAWDLALKFHRDVAIMIGETCSKIYEKTGVRRVALSGGVFQNRLLMEETLKLLRRKGFSVYYNLSVPPNDGGISLGQAFIGLM